ncbi:MAG: glycoside hydrolase family 92 protein, partial [Muribaculaceae bacterium]|nr:glycoside hydrolase family 92 protein [Muribaculaceae bacterium]
RSALNTPIFEDIIIHQGKGNDINIKGGSEKNIYTAGLKLNGKKHDSTWVDWSALENGATLEFATSSTPNKKWGTEILPPSFD